MIRFNDAETVVATVTLSVTVALIVVGIRVWLIQRARGGLQRELRIQTERLKALVGACRTLAGSFSPPVAADAHALGEALNDVLLFGSLEQVRLAAQAATALSQGDLPDCQPLVDSLRTELRGMLGLDPLPDDLTVPPASPNKARFLSRRTAVDDRR